MQFTLVSPLTLRRSSAATDLNLLSRLGVTHILNCAAPLPGAKSVVRKYLNVETGAAFYEPLGLQPSQYLEIYADDLPVFDLSQYFERTTRFIDDALSPQPNPNALPAGSGDGANDSDSAPQPQAQPLDAGSGSASQSDATESPGSGSAVVPSASPSAALATRPQPEPERAARVLVHCREGVSRSATVVLAYLLLRAREPVASVEEALRLVRSRRSVCPNGGFLVQLVQLERRLHPELSGRDADGNDERNSQT